MTFLLRGCRFSFLLSYLILSKISGFGLSFGSLWG
jgi:hypothetical protein